MKYYSILVLSFLTLLGTSCNSTDPVSEEKGSESRVPVTITHVIKGKLSDVVALNATSSFLMKTSVKATVNGYLQEVFIKSGDKVLKGQKLFTIRSKEAEHLGNLVNQVDSSFRFSGLSYIKSPVSGYITQLNYLAGNYVQDGEELASISETNSLVFLLDLPYELKPCLVNNKTLELLLPDGQKLSGTFSSSLPMVDIVSQTQTCIIKVATDQPIPENLIAKINFIKKSKQNTLSLPKEAILTNEVQSEFWIMKMTDSITAVKVPVTKGIENDDRVEILSPILQPADMVLLTGNFGLPDTAKVIIENAEK